MRWPTTAGPSAARHAGRAHGEGSEGRHRQQDGAERDLRAEPEGEAWREECAREHRRDAGEGDRDGDRKLEKDAEYRTPG